MTGANNDINVKIDWPLSDGHSVSMKATRQLTDTEWQNLMRLLRLAKPGFVRASLQAAVPCPQGDSADDA